MPVLAAATFDMSSIISAVSAWVTAAIGWVGNFITVITTSGNEILLVGFIIGLVGLGVGLLRRLAHVF